MSNSNLENDKARIKAILADLSKACEKGAAEVESASNHDMLTAAVCSASGTISNLNDLTVAMSRILYDAMARADRGESLPQGRAASLGSVAPQISMAVNISASSAKDIAEKVREELASAFGKRDGF